MFGFMGDIVNELIGFINQQTSQGSLTLYSISTGYLMML